MKTNTKIALTKQSIKFKVIFLIVSLTVTAIALMTITVGILSHKQINQQTHEVLKNRAENIFERFEQRVQYLIENTSLLSSNELMVNALTDVEGRKNYLPPLVANFMKGKDVVSVNVTDFEGKRIFQTHSKIPLYNESKQLRNALAMGELAFYINDKNLVVVSPIKYYDTTQGAVIVVFNIQDILKRNTTQLNKNTYIKLLYKEHSIYTYNFSDSKTYETLIYKPYKLHSLSNELGISIEVGVPEKIYYAPLQKTMFILFAIGLLFTITTLFLSIFIAKKITDPIIELYNRVNSSDENTLCSPLGTKDELDELASAFDERTLKLQYQAEHDSLTNLPNRVLFIDRLEQSIRAAKENGTNIAVAFLDLDRFKEVNDSFGHEFGDSLIMQVGEKIEGALKHNHSMARLGGDEFILLLNDINENSVIDIINDVMSLFKEPFLIEHHKFFITPSIGIAMYPEHGTTHEELLRNADSAMYKAKEIGRNTYQFYTDEMTKKAIKRMTLETQLRQAVQNEEFEVYYQPQVNMKSQEIIGMEALIRWIHPSMGLISPDQFIPLAEETGMIVEIDRWVMRTAMKQFVKWQNSGFTVGCLSLNLSMVQLNHEDFIDEVKDALEDSEIAPNLVMFEVTETQVMKNPENSILMLQELKKLGVSMAIDDFGTGHSSLSYIKRLPIDKIKIDKSFVSDIPDDKDDMELTKAIIAIANSIKLEVIAEGVETKEQALFLIESGCYEAQGYFYYKPKNVANITQRLSSK